MGKKVQPSQLTVVEASQPSVNKLAISVSAAWTSKCLTSGLGKLEAFTKGRSD